MWLPEQPRCVSLSSGEGGTFEDLLERQLHALQVGLSAALVVSIHSLRPPPMPLPRCTARRPFPQWLGGGSLPQWAQSGGWWSPSLPQTRRGNCPLRSEAEETQIQVSTQAKGWSGVKVQGDSTTDSEGGRQGAAQVSVPGAAGQEEGRGPRGRASPVSQPGWPLEQHWHHTSGSVLSWLLSPLASHAPRCAGSAACQHPTGQVLQRRVFYHQRTPESEGEPQPLSTEESAICKPTSLSPSLLPSLPSSSPPP